jgi:hypothetical protein
VAAVLLSPASVRAQRANAPGTSAPHATKQRAEALMPGFETLDDGSTRLFVDLSETVSYETKAAKGSTTYVLKGTHVARRNNCNALATAFFNTPVTTARLVPHGTDLWFVVEVRAPVEPAVSVDAKKEGGATLSIRFPKGDYLPAPRPVESAGESAADESAPGAASPATAPTAAPTRPPAPMRAPHTGGSGRSRRRGGSTQGN